jgi:hypothetical protein
MESVKHGKQFRNRPASKSTRKPVSPLDQALSFATRQFCAGREWIEIESKNDYFGEGAVGVLERARKRRKHAKVFAAMPDETLDDDRELKGFVIASEWVAELYDGRGMFVALFHIGDGSLS